MLLNEWWLIAEIVSDIAIASMMSWILQQCKTGIKKSVISTFEGLSVSAYLNSHLLRSRTNSLLNKLVLYTVSTGAITALFSIALLTTVLIRNSISDAMLSVLYSGSKCNSRFCL